MSHRIEVLFVSKAVPGCWIRKRDKTSENPVSPQAEKMLSSGRGENACLVCRWLCCQLDLHFGKIS